MNFIFKHCILALGVLIFDTANAQMCSIDHELFSHNVEIGIKVRCQPGDPDTFFGLTFVSNAGPYEGIFAGAWCVDLDRRIQCGRTFNFDAYSSYDQDSIPSDAVDKPENLDLLNWLMNHYPIDSLINIDGCYSGVLGYEEYQEAIWKIIDHAEHDLGGLHCVIDYLAEQAETYGDGYEPDCFDPNAKLGVLLVHDDDDGTITKQVELVEIPLANIDNACICVNPGVGGDPHIRTWSNKMYDFHGICDLVLLQNPDFQEGFGMDIHVRTKQIKHFSYVSSAALRIGADILEVMGDDGDNLFWVNKQPNRNVVNGIVGFVSGHPISYRKLNSKQHEFTLTIGGKKSIIMTTFKTFVRVSIHGTTEESFGPSLGLLGSYNSGEMVARDNSTVIEDTNEFGQEWQVLPHDGMLFHNVEGPQAPKKCQLPLASNLRRRLTESYISEEGAGVVCADVGPSDFDMCVFDVMATGDKGIVGAYH